MQYIEMLNITQLGVLILVMYALSLVVPALVGIYLVLNFFSAPLRHKKKTYNEPPKTFFAVIIPARNEEKVIQHTIEALKKIDYPRELYEILLIADNCTDKTALLGKTAGANVFIRKDISKRSKAHAMKWLFDQNCFLEKKYDAICILDADAVLESDFLKAMDEEICNGYEIIQGRCGSINPYESTTSGFMTVLASVQNRLWYLPQSNRKRSGFYIGTGVCITFDRIKKTGWNISTLVEDAEFSIQSVLMGGFVRYCDDARYYVEQVTTFKELWKQQRRWRTGQIDCLKKYIKPLLKSVFKDKNKNSISLLILILIPVLCMSFIFQTVMTPILFGEFFGYDKFQPLMIAGGFLINIIVMFLLYSFILWMDGIFSIKLWKGILSVIFSPIFYGLVDITSVFRPMKEWNPILHGQSNFFLKRHELHIKDFKKLSFRKFIRDSRARRKKNKKSSDI